MLIYNRHTDLQSLLSDHLISPKLHVGLTFHFALPSLTVSQLCGYVVEYALTETFSIHVKPFVPRHARRHELTSTLLYTVCPHYYKSCLAILYIIHSQKVVNAGILARHLRHYGIYLLPIWGMTETSPLATLGSANKQLLALPEDERYALQSSAGKPMFGIEIEIFDEETNTKLAHDGEARGLLRVRGPWVLKSYYKSDKTDCFVKDQEGNTWFDTGDIATIDAHSYLRIVDRAKDVVKSGGEWISSIDLENAAQGCEGVVEACVIGVKHIKWDERPLLFIVRDKGIESQAERLDKEAVYQFLTDKIAKWWMPDDIIFVDQLPHTATGKLQKRTLRDEYWNYLVDND